MTILTIPQLELLIFLKSPMIPKWILKDSGYGYGFKYGYGFSYGFGDGFIAGSGSGIGSGKSKK